MLNHPNSWECHVYKKIVNRVGGSVVGGLPTIGGMGVLSSDDEDDISWELVGMGYALQADMSQPSIMMDRLDANNGFSDDPRFLIEPEKPSGMPGFFEVRKHYVVYIVITDEVKLAFEVVDIEAVTNIPPFTIRYVTNRRADLDVMPA